jgi:hypothetical protein
MKVIKEGKGVNSSYEQLVVGMTPGESLILTKDLVSEYIEGYETSFGKPSWLKSNINENNWTIELGKAERIINFDIEFQSSSGSQEKLIAPEHRKLLNVFKCWLLIHSSPLHIGFQTVSKKTLSKKLRTTLYLIDYILLNSDVLGLDKHFLLWSPDTVNTILARLFDKESISGGVYDTEERLDLYIEQNIVKYGRNELEKGFDKLAVLFDLDKQSSIYQEQELFLKLGFLHLEKAFELKRSKARYGKLSIPYLRKTLYKNTLYGNRVKLPLLEKYSVGKGSCYNKTSEYVQHPLSKRFEIGISERYFRVIRQNIYMLSDINQFSNLVGLMTAKVNGSIFKDISLNALMNMPAKQIGRTITVGAGEILPQIRNAFEFIYEHGDVILSNVEELLSVSKEKIQKTSLKEFRNFGYKNHLSKEATELGVEVIGYGSDEVGRYKKRRENKDLFFLFNVIQGSLQLIVGATMARRMGELVELDPFEALTPKDIDPEEHRQQDFNLIFDNRKSGVAYDGEIIREQLSRPILNSIASIIYKWQCFNLRLKQNGVIDQSKELGLFTSLSSNSLAVKEGNTESFVDNLDAFCDYFETRTYIDEHGVTRRLYIRQHQLRRFFAMVFYWAYGYEASDTLRYFMGHTDIEHLEQYIMEETSGEVLRGVQAERLIDGVRNKDIKQISELEIILKNKFGLNSIEFRTYEEIQEDIEDEIIVLEAVHEHVIPQRYENYDLLLNSLDSLLEQGVINLKAEYATVTSKDGKEQAVMDLALKYE